MKLFLGICTLLASITLLSGCGPVYKTTYSYRMPQGLSANKCTNSCLWQRNRCQSRCQRNYQSCEAEMSIARTQAQAVYNDCERHRNRRLRRHPNANVSECYENTPYDSCSRRCNCLPDYNQCYSSCGGTVIPHQVCVAFCPKPKVAGILRKTEANGS